MVETRSGRKLGQPSPGGAPRPSQAWRVPVAPPSPAAAHDLRAARRWNEAACGLPTLPLELIEAICRPLSMQDRVALASCCGTLHSREDVAGSVQLWESLTITRRMVVAPHAPLMAWLARRRSCLRSLTLCSKGKLSLNPDALLGGLTGSMLTSLQLSASCELKHALPQQLSALTGLMSLEVHGSFADALSDAGWAPLQHLVSLTRVDISNCSLRRLPEQLSSLGRLAELCMGPNRTIDSSSLTVFQHLTALTLLDARGCNLYAIPEQLSAATRLAALLLPWNYGCGYGGEEAVEPLRHLRHLTRLDIAYCSLRGIPAPLAALTGLGCLSLAGNRLAASAWAGLQPLTMLTSLDLASSQLAYLPQQLTCCSALGRLCLARNRLGEGGDNVCDALQQLGRSLTSISLGSCHFRRPPAQLSALTHLLELDLGHNMNLGQDGDAAFWPLQHLTSLTLLDLRYCYLASLPHQLAELPSLAALELKGSINLPYASWEPLPQLPALTRLGLGSSSLATLPQQLSELDTLRDLTVSSYGIYKRDCGAFVEALGALVRPLTRLTRLTGYGLGADLGERLAAAGVHVPCIRN